MDAEYKDTKKVLFAELNEFETFSDGVLHHICIKIPDTHINGTVANSIRISDKFEVIEYRYASKYDIAQRIKVKMIVET